MNTDKKNRWAKLDTDIEIVPNTDDRESTVKDIDLRPYKKTPRTLTRSGDGTAATAFGWFARLFIMPHVLVGLGLIIYPFINLSGIAFGLDVPGHVVEKWTHVDDENGREFDVEIAYDWDGAKQYKEFSVKRTQYEKYKNGDEVVVRFLPQLRDLTIGFRDKGAALQVIPDLGTFAFYVFFTLFWNLIVGVFVYILYVAPILNDWLLKNGKVTRGVVTGKESHCDSESSSYTVLYTFTPDREKASNKEKSLTLTHLPQGVQGRMNVPLTTYTKITSGDAVMVVYDPKHPRINTVFEYSGYDIRHQG